jgi:nucleotide-binding universal stress UspA family protein
MFERVVVGVTDSAGAERAFRRALDVTRATRGTLHIVGALSNKEGVRPYLPAEFRYTVFGAGKTDWLLARLRARAEKAHVRVETHPVLAGPADAIARVAAQEDADLVVLGSGFAHGSRRLSGVSTAVMDAVGCAVLVV